MRITCPYCGERDLIEFAYMGPADISRPDGATPEAAVRLFEAVYLRDNPAGPHTELWYHRSGCRSWLRVVRDTRTHAIIEIAFVGSNPNASAAGAPT